MEVLVGAVGRLKKGPLRELMETYQKRLLWKFRLYEVEAKSPLPSPHLSEEESRLLQEGMPKGSYIIALDEKGASVSSPQLAQLMEKWQSLGKPLVFLIGGADGHSPSLLTQAHFRLSLGPLTWPHMVARFLLVEQLYRAQQILQGHPYHRE